MSSHLDRIIDRAAALVAADQLEEAWRVVEALGAKAASNAALARVWVRAASASPLDDGVAATATEIIRCHPEETVLLIEAASILSLVAENRPFDEPPLPEGPARIAADTLRRVIDSLTPEQGSDEEALADLYSNLAMALRMTGSADDKAALEAMQESLRLRPEDGWRWFQLGLIHKWRGRWNEGVEANRRARELGAESQGVLWNLAICAMGAGFYPLAASVMKELGMKGEVGEDGIFTGSFDPVQVRISSLGEGIDPAVHVVGAEPDFEYIWIERHSLVHGTILNATIHDMPADFGDVVLFDGAAVGYRDDGTTRVPRFPLLQKLRSGAVRRYRFRAQQPHGGFLEGLSEKLPTGTTFYVHDEQVNMLCRDCATAGRVSDDHPHADSSFVSGKLIVPEASLGAALAEQLDALLGEEAVVAVPALYRDLGDDSRAKREEAKWIELEPRNVQRNVIVCATHGSTEPTFVCSHLAEGQGLGFFSSGGDNSTRSDAWCGACERVRIAEGGDWNDRSEEFAQIRMICGFCYDDAKRRNVTADDVRARRWWEFWR
jgi:hypothetical protein